MYKGKMKGVLYKAGVGSLKYAMVAARANISFAVSTISHFISKAIPPHWMAVKRIMRYLKNTLICKLCHGGKNITLKGFCNVDWARQSDNVNNRRSTTGYVFFIGVGVIL